MALPDNFELRQTRQGKMSGGHKRALPGIGASGIEIRSIHLNSNLDPETSVEATKDYLLPPSIYGDFKRNPSKNRFSRNF